MRKFDLCKRRLTRIIHINKTCNCHSTDSLINYSLAVVGFVEQETNVELTIIDSVSVFSPQVMLIIYM